MEFEPFEQGKRADREPSEPVWPEVVDVAGLSLSELRARLGLIKKSESRLAAMKTAALAEYASRGGEGLARRVAARPGPDHHDIEFLRHARPSCLRRGAL